MNSCPSGKAIGQGACNGIVADGENAKISQAAQGLRQATRDRVLEHIEKLQMLLEKQRVMYTRLSLSEDPKAVEMKENLRKSVALMGFPPETDMQVLFNSMTKTIESLKQFVDH